MVRAAAALAGMKLLMTGELSTVCSFLWWDAEAVAVKGNGRMERREHRARNAAAGPCGEVKRTREAQE